MSKGRVGALIGLAVLFALSGCGSGSSTTATTTVTEKASVASQGTTDQTASPSSIAESSERAQPLEKGDLLVASDCGRISEPLEVEVSGRTYTDTVALESPIYPECNRTTRLEYAVKNGDQDFSAGIGLSAKTPANQSQKVKVVAVKADNPAGEVVLSKTLSPVDSIQRIQVPLERVSRLRFVLFNRANHKLSSGGWLYSLRVYLIDPTITGH